MQHYFAPLEGLTDHIYRRLHHKYFPGVDRYYTPFLSPTAHQKLTSREARELPPADSLDAPTVPQLLTKNAADFLWAAEQCAQRGYTQVNFNAGCPSGTVVAKGKGAGMLADLDGLDRFLDAVCSASPVAISVKTRLGMEAPEEFVRILEIYDRYPIAELIVHPRIRREFYKSPVHSEWFQYAQENCKLPLCYNGDLCSPEEISALCERFPKTRAVMLGRGLIGDPGMLSPGGTQADVLEAFCAELLEGYIRSFGGPRNAMFRMKEHWRYLLCRFEDGQKIGKQLRKTTDVAEYQALIARLFREHPLKARLEPDWRSGDAVHLM